MEYDKMRIPDEHHRGGQGKQGSLTLPYPSLQILPLDSRSNDANLKV